MGRHDRAKRSAMTSKARRDFALSRLELRDPSEAREAPASPTSFPVKRIDPDAAAAIEAFLSRRRVGQ
jgi:hypothetical protein